MSPGNSTEALRDGTDASSSGQQDQRQARVLMCLPGKDLEAAQHVSLALLPCQGFGLVAFELARLGHLLLHQRFQHKLLMKLLQSHGSLRTIFRFTKSGPTGAAAFVTLLWSVRQDVSGHISVALQAECKQPSLQHTSQSHSSMLLRVSGLSRQELCLDWRPRLLQGVCLSKWGVAGPLPPHVPPSSRRTCLASGSSICGLNKAEANCGQWM